MLRRTREGARDADAAALARALERLEAAASRDRRLDVLLDPDLRQVMARVQPRSDLTRHDRELEVVVDRPAAAFAAWYELFPRSQGRVPGRHGTFDDCVDRLPEIQRMGFDVVYLPPIHPIGRTARKGPDNALVAGPGDPGSPWAIGGPEGGHTAVHPELGTLEDFRRLVKTAQGLGMEIALDFAIQCSPDHPWVREHPEWFYRRPDGTIKYAENPPKKYQDIYPINFATPAWESLWDALLGVVRFWIDQGVRTFRVDNPHTKPLDFWTWLIREVQDRDPDVDVPLRGLHPPQGDARARQGRLHPVLHLLHLAQLQGRADRVSRGADALGDGRVLPRQLLRQHARTSCPRSCSAAGRPPSACGPPWPPRYRPSGASTAATSSARRRPCPAARSTGPRRSTRSGCATGTLPATSRTTSRGSTRSGARTRRSHTMAGLRFYPADSPHVLFYGKLTPARDNVILVAVNLDPFATHEATLADPARRDRHRPRRDLRAPRAPGRRPPPRARGHPRGHARPAHRARACLSRGPLAAPRAGLRLLRVKT